jgi:Fe2+ transport system protein FeoA
VEKMTIEKIQHLSGEIPEIESREIIQRLYELGLRPGLEISILRKVSFGSVTVIQFGQTRLALNKQEMSCLHGRS